MKRRLAFLLALSLTFASFPVAGAGATETAAATDTEVVTVVEQEENSGEGASVEGEAVDPTNEVKDETAGEAGTTKGQETTQTEEVTDGTETVDPAAEDKDAVEEAAAGITEDAGTGLTETEVAAAEEPEMVTAVVAPAEVVEVKEEKKAAAATTPANKVQPHWVSSGGDWYYVTGTGANATGFLTIEGVRYYFYGDGAMATGWVYDAGSWYYFNGSGAMRRGWLYDGGKWYFLESGTGKMVKGHKTIDGVRYFFYNNGAMATGWVYDKGAWYYFDNSGAIHKGWLLENGKWYFLNPTFGKMAIGWQGYKGKYYYLYRDGSMATGWDKIGGKWYYFGSSGARSIGWVYYKGDWYYMNNGGVMLTHWQEIDGNWYYLDPSSGAMASAPRYCTSAWDSRTNNYYFFYEDGRLGTGEGPKKNGGIEYYTNAAGILYRNKTIKGKYYDEYGRYGDPMDTKAQGYSSGTNYLILCDKTKFKVRVYKGSKGSWTRIKDWDCTHGGSDTPNGVFTIDDHVTKRDATWGWADFDFSSAAFACHISAGNYFHSILFDKGTRGNPYNQSYRILDDQLRTTYSHGCIRLKLENAEWVWDNIPFGTKVVVYNS